MHRLLQAYKIVCFLLFYTLSFLVYAEGVEKPFLWKIEGDKTSYLFGTIHVADPRVTQLHPSAEAAFKQSTFVVTEIPLEMSTILTQTQHMILPGETTLYDLVPKDLLQRTESILQKISPALTIEPLLKFKIWALAASLPLLEQQLKNPAALPLDAQLYQRALTEEKNVGGLETLEEQLHIFDSLNNDEQVKMLGDTVEFMEQAEAEGVSIVEQFIQKYSHGDLENFGAYMMKYVKQDEFYNQFMRKILHNRNYLMAERIDHKLKNDAQNTYFFAVGAGHYWGETGVQNLLIKKGYKITRILE